MGIQIGAKPDSGFENPIGMLTDCHRRIESFLRVLCVVADRARGRALTEEEKEAVESALRYFRSGGKRHTADEEESLFPRLRRASSGNNIAELAGLERDHEKADALHHAVEVVFLEWIAKQRLSADEESRLHEATEELQRLYEAHIQVEELEVFPRASRLLDRESIAQIGEEFRARRA